MKLAVFAFGAALIASAGAQDSRAGTRPLPAQANADRALQLLNAERGELELSAVAIDVRLMRVAEARAASCPSVGQCNRPAAESLTERFSRAGYPPSFAGEAILDNQDSISDAFEKWARTSGASSTILSAEATHMGFAAVTDGERSFYVLEIGGDTKPGWTWKGPPSS